MLFKLRKVISDTVSFSNIMKKYVTIQNIIITVLMLAVILLFHVAYIHQNQIDGNYNSIKQEVMNSFELQTKLRNKKLID